MNARRAPLLTTFATALLVACPSWAANEATPADASADEGPNCLNLYAIRRTRVLDSRTILFEMNGNKTFVNRLPNNCPGLGFEKRFMYKTSLNQLCGQDIITVLTDMGRGASCGLGRFEAYVVPEGVDGEAARGSLEPAPATN